MKFLAHTNHDNEKTKEALESKAGDLVGVLGDFFIDIHYKEDRNKTRNPEQSKPKNVNETKQNIDEPSGGKTPHKEGPSLFDGLNLNNLTQNQPEPSKPVQNPPQQQPALQHINPQPQLQSQLAEEKPKQGAKPPSKLSGLFGDLKKKENPTVNLDHIIGPAKPKEEAKNTQPTGNTVQAPVLPNQTISKPAPNPAPTAGKYATPFLGQRPAYLEEDDDFLGGNLL